MSSSDQGPLIHSRSLCEQVKSLSSMPEVTLEDVLKASIGRYGV